jgi:hypothetical protein
MLFSIELNQVILLFILAAAFVLTEWTRLGLIAILKGPVWHKLMIPRVGFDPAEARSSHFVRSNSV